jgi:hypothetical protein
VTAIIAWRETVLVVYRVCSEAAMNKSKTFAVIKRVTVEFGLPVVVGIGWMVSELGRSGTPAGYVKQFGVAFFMASWVWGQLLRIVYQQGQREEMKAIGAKLEEAAGTMEALKATTDVLMAKVDPSLPAEVRHMISLARAASGQVNSANMAYHALALARRLEPPPAVTRHLVPPPAVTPAVPPNRLGNHDGLHRPPNADI